VQLNGEHLDKHIVALVAKINVEWSWWWLPNRDWDAPPFGGLLCSFMCVSHAVFIYVHMYPIHTYAVTLFWWNGSIQLIYIAASPVIMAASCHTHLIRRNCWNLYSTTSL